MPEEFNEYRKPLKAIRDNCLECMCGQAYQVKFCTIKNCPLYNFRFGRNPFNKRELTDEQRREMADRLKKNTSK